MDRRRFLSALLPVPLVASRPEAEPEVAMMIMGDGGVRTMRLSEPNAVLAFGRNPETGAWYAINEKAEKARIL